MGNRMRTIIGGKIAIVVVALSAAAMLLIPGSTPTRPAPQSGNFNNAIAGLRGSRIEAALRPVPPVHDALWPPLLPVFM